MQQKGEIKRRFLEKDFTHFDSRGNAIMVDVSEKETSSRTATAKGIISMNSKAMNAVLGGTAKKGDVLGAARIAGIMAAKRCAELIPLCHQLAFDKCTIDFSIKDNSAKDKSAKEKSAEEKSAGEKSAEENQIEGTCTIKLSGKTGAEMEALTGVSVALLTIYDMCKALDRAMVISGIRLIEKSGGKSGRFFRGETP